MTAIRRTPAPLAGGYESGGLRFLVGAGISLDAPSCIPPARPIMDALCGWLAAGDAGSDQEAGITGLATRGQGAGVDRSALMAFYPFPYALLFSFLAALPFQ